LSYNSYTWLCSIIIVVYRYFYLLKEICNHQTITEKKKLLFKSFIKNSCWHRLSTVQCQSCYIKAKLLNILLLKCFNPFILTVLLVYLPGNRFLYVVENGCFSLDGDSMLLVEKYQWTSKWMSKTCKKFWRKIRLKSNEISEYLRSLFMISVIYRKTSYMTAVNDHCNQPSFFVVNDWGYGRLRPVEIDLGGILFCFFRYSMSARFCLATSTIEWTFSPNSTQHWRTWTWSRMKLIEYSSIFLL
jgi:hypothetical protein